MNRMQRRVKRALACTLAIATLAGMTTITANAQKRQFSFKTRSGRSGRTAPAYKGDDCYYELDVYRSNQGESIGLLFGICRYENNFLFVL